MTINLYAKIEELVERLKVKIDSNYKIEHNSNDNIILISNNINIIKINYRMCDLPIRSFSNPVFASQKYILQISNNNNSLHEIFNTIINTCNEYSDEEIMAILNDMPIAGDYSKANSSALSGVAIIWRDHFLEENIGLLNGFVNMGISRNDIMALDKGDQTKHQNQIRATFKKMGFIVDILDNSVINDDNKIGPEADKIYNFIETRKDKKVLVIDDGAIVSKILNNKYYDNVKAIVELTEMGLRRISHLENGLLYPVLNIAKTNLKRNITYPEIANSIFIRVIELIGGEKLVGRSILLCGYGDMGEILADRFRAFGIRVIIYDPDIMKLIVSGEKGYTTYDDILTAVVEEKPILVIGASGYKSITDEVVRSLPNNSYVTAGATADLSIFLEYEKDQNIEFRRVKNYGTQYRINSKFVTVLGNGRSVNLFDSEAIPNKANDIFKAAILVTCNQAINSKEHLKNQLDVNIVEYWINKSGILNSYYNMYLKRK